MRILMLAQFYPPTIGGEERFVADLSAALVERGHTVSVATTLHKGFAHFEIHQGVRIHRITGTMQRMSTLFSQNNRRYAPPFPDPEFLLALRQVMQEEQPEIVHAHNWIGRSFTPLKAWSKARLVASLHDYSHVCVQKRLMRQNVRCSGPGLTRCLACATHFYGPTKGPLATASNFFWAARERKAVDIFLPVSQAVVEGNQLEKYRVPYTIVPNFVPDQLEKVDNEHDPFLAQLPKGAFLLFVGDITLDKGVEVLLRAYAGSGTHIPLVLIGRSYLKDVEKHLPPNVLLMGPWPHPAVMGAWRRCLFGLVPSTWADPCPTVAMEAMAMGKSVIATRSGGLVDIVSDGETGLLIPPNDSLALRGAIQTLLEQPALRERMERLARQSVKKFQTTAVVAQFEQIYQKLLATDAASASALVDIGSR